MRELSYCQAIREALIQVFEEDERYFIMGLGIDDYNGLFGSTIGLSEKFGKKRVMDIPVSENSVTGICTGAAIAGMRPVMCHARIDFLLVTMDQIVNHMAKWHYMYGGNNPVPVTIRCIIGKGWGQGAQHSQSLQSLFAFIPGLKVVMPSSPYDAKGLLVASLKDPNPVIFIEHRRLYNLTEHVPEEMYEVPLSQSAICRKGKDVTVIATSILVQEALNAAEKLALEGIDVEVVDPRTLSPMDRQTLINSVKHTGRLVAADTGHKTAGFAGEIISSIVEECYNELKSAPCRVTSPDIPPPTSYYLEDSYFPDSSNIVDAVRKVCGVHVSKSKLVNEKKGEDKNKENFYGPF